MGDLFLKVLNMSVTAAYVVVFVFFLRLLLKRAPRWISYALWSLVLFRLVCPVSFESVVSVFGRLGGAIPSAVSGGMVFIPSGTGPVSGTPVNPVVTGSFGTAGSGMPDLPAAAETASAALPDTSMAQLLLFIGVCAWLSGLAVMLIYGAVSYIRLRRRVAEATRVEGHVFETDAIASPFVLGFFRPKIYLPLGLNETGRAYVLNHERAHIKRGDHIVRLLAFVTLSVHWFNPFVWLAFILSGRDMETSCDERVLRALEPGARVGYGQTLAGLAVKRPLLSGSPLAFGENGVKTRVRNVLNYKKPAFWIACVAVIAAAAAALCLLTNPKKELSGEPYASGAATLSVLNSGTEYEGVGISMRAYELSANLNILTVDWKNDSEYNATYGSAYHIYKLENDAWVSCAKEKETSFDTVGHVLPAFDSDVMNYYNHAFDLSRTGTYRLETTFFFDKDIPITEEDQYTVWIEFDISPKAVYGTYAETLYALKTPDIGNYTAVGAILEALGVGDIGEYTFEPTYEPRTETDPYGITVSFKDGTVVLSGEEAHRKMMYYGGLFLALVDNAETLTWYYPDGSGGPRARQISYNTAGDAFNQTLGDIKQYGASPELFEKLVSLLSKEADLSPSGDDQVTTALEAAVIGYMEDGWWYGGELLPGEKHPGTFKAASFVTLYEEETDGGRAYYGVSLYRSYNFTENSFTIAESFQEPCVITLDNKTLVCTDFWVPGDGAYFEMDIVEKFPKWLVEEVALYATNYLEQQAAECDEKARQYGGFEDTTALMTVTSDSTTVLPYENLLWSRIYAEDNSSWLSGDAISVLRDLGAVLDQLPTVTLREDFSMTYAADVTYNGVTVVAGESLEVLYRNADKMVLTALPEGTYYVVVGVTKQGDYIEAGGDFESEGYECVFRYVVDEHSYDNMLMSRPIAEKVCIDLRRTADRGLAGYLAPKDQNAWLAAFSDAVSKGHEQEGARWLDSEASLGIYIAYQDTWWEFLDSGALVGHGVRVEAGDAAGLFELAMPVIEQYYGGLYRPDRIEGVISATLELSGRTFTVTDAAALSKLENLLSTAKELRGGAGCPFGALLGLETASDAVAVALSTDDCPTYLVNGVYFEYDAESNKELYALFGVTLPEMILSPTPVKWSRDELIGVDMASLDYASDDIVIFHGPFGLFVYDLHTTRFIHSVDLKPIDCHYTQGSNVCEVTVSEDGDTVLLHPVETNSMYVYTVSENTLIKTAHQPLDRRFGPTVMIDDVIDSESIGAYSYRAVKFGTDDYGYLHTTDWTLGTLTYVRGDAVYALFNTET